MKFFNRNINNPSLKRIADFYESDYVKTFEQVKKEWNQIIRNFYSKSMGVSLSEENGRTQIPITIVPAKNEEFIDLIEKNFPNLDFEEFSILTNYVENAKLSQKFFVEPKALYNLERSIDFAEYRLRDFDISFIISKLFHFLEPENPDVFGCYYINSGRIEIFIAPCVLFCQLLGLDLKSFIVKILAHELAHGYNHLGRDKDGYYWQGFEFTDDNLAEGLANFYCYEFLKKYQFKNPNLLNVFHETISQQPPCYEIFRDWDTSLEQLYSAFIETRRNNVHNYSIFLQLLDESKRRIRQGI